MARENPGEMDLISRGMIVGRNVGRLQQGIMNWNPNQMGGPSGSNYGEQQGVEYQNIPMKLEEVGNPRDAQRIAQLGHLIDASLKHQEGLLVMAKETERIKEGTIMERRKSAKTIESSESEWQQEEKRESKRKSKLKLKKKPLKRETLLKVSKHRTEEEKMQ